MINTNELRIGNWLYGYNPMDMGTGSKGYFQVVNLEDERINVWRVEGFSDESANGVPIPLTPEILIKCGFEKSNDNYGGYLSKEMFRVQPVTGYRLRIREKDNRLYYDSNSFDTTIEYLHQLQNLYYSLTGQELNYTP